MGERGREHPRGEKAGEGWDVRNEVPHIDFETILHTSFRAIFEQNQRYSKMRKILAIFTISLMPAMAFAGSLPGDTNSPADRAVKSAIDAGKIIPCDSPGGSCQGREMNYRVFYGPDKTTAVAWVFGFPTEGTVHLGQYAEFKDYGGWKLVKVFQKPYADAPAPEDKDVKFLSASKVKVTYHFKKDSDPNCCATGLGTTVLNLQ